MWVRFPPPALQVSMKLFLAVFSPPWANLDMASN